MNNSMRDDFKRDGVLSQIIKRISDLEAFEREFRVKQFGSGGGGGFTEGARVYNSANISIPSATTTPLTFDSEYYDTDGIHDLGVNTGRLTCQTAGKYAIMGCVIWASNATGIRSHQIILNGGNLIARQDFQAVSVAGFGTASVIATIWDMGVGDYVTFDVYQGSAGNLLVAAIADYSPVFMMQRIG